MNMSIDLAGKWSMAATAGRRGWHAAQHWLEEVDRRVLVIGGVLLALALGLLVWVLLTDQSRVLDARETEAVRSWVLATQSQDVVVAFNAAVGDGRLTVNEVKDLMEDGKAAAIPAGMYQPVDP